jgi:hypothetical protein
MSAGRVRSIVFLLLALYLISLTWPGILPFNRIRPLVFGLPFVLFWICLWIVVIALALGFLDAAEAREAAHRERAG